MRINLIVTVALSNFNWIYAKQEYENNF